MKQAGKHEVRSGAVFEHKAEIQFRRHCLLCNKTNAYPAPVDASSAREPTWRGSTFNDGCQTLRTNETYFNKYKSLLGHHTGSSIMHCEVRRATANPCSGAWGKSHLCTTHSTASASPKQRAIDMHATIHTLMFLNIYRMIRGTPSVDREHKC